MHKVFSKSPIQTLSLALLIASTPTFAGYSNDPDCQAVSGSAQNGASKIYTQVDESAKGTGDAIARTKSCVDQLLEQANRSVPDFGGVASVIAKFAKDLMSQQACLLISGAQSQSRAPTESARFPTTYTGPLQGVMQSENTNMESARFPTSYTGPLQGVMRSENTNTSVAPPAVSTPSIWQRIANAF